MKQNLFVKSMSLVLAGTFLLMCFACGGGVFRLIAVDTFRLLESSSDLVLAGAGLFV